MPTLLADTRLLGLYAGVIPDNGNYLFLQSGAQDQIDAMFQTPTGARPLFTLNGKVIRSSGGVPPNSLAGSGDFYIDTLNWKIYGPKTTESGTWGTGTSLIGPSGAAGPSGATGATGPLHTGLIGGNTFEILSKNSATNYDFSYRNVFDIIRGANNRMGRPSRFTEVYRNLSLIGNSGSSLPVDMGSGCTFEPKTNTIYVVDNGTPSISQFAIDGTYIRTINLSGFKDIEAIDWMHDDYFVIAEEYNAAGSAYINKLHIVQILDDGPQTIANNPGVLYHIREIDLSAHLTNASPNIGIEGVAYDKDRDIFYVVTEKAANEGWKLWQVDNDSVVSISAIFDLNTALAQVGANVPTDVTDIFYKRDTNTIVMSTEESFSYILEFDLSGNLIDYFSIPSIFYQIEGVCFSPNGEFMFITGEANTVGGDKPDYAIFQYNNGSNPTTNSASHGLMYFHNQKVGYIRGKFFDSVDTYSTSTNNTYQGINVSWPIGSRYATSGMMLRGREIVVDSFGEFVHTGWTDDLGDLYFKFTDAAGTTIAGINNPTGVRVSGTTNWHYNSTTSFTESGYVSQSIVELYNTNFDVSKKVITNNSGLLNGLVTGNLDFAVKFNITGSPTIKDFFVKKVNFFTN